MSDYIKYMYREYLEGRTRIKKVNEDQPLFPNSGREYGTAAYVKRDT